MIEKNRAALLAQKIERSRAQAGESQAIDREQSTLEVARQSEELIAELARMQRAAQAGARSASIALRERRAKDLGARFVTDLQSPVTARIDAGELEHVILNLVSSALDAVSTVPAGQREVVVSAQVTDQQVMIRVQDSGPCISQSVRDQLFDLFARSRAEGLGLGLWLSRYIVERHDGAIDLDCGHSAPGALFLVRLEHGSDQKADGSTFAMSDAWFQVLPNQTAVGNQDPAVFAGSGDNTPRLQLRRVASCEWKASQAIGSE